MTMRTYKEWQSLGYQVMKGERSSARDADGVALFREDQTYDLSDEDIDYDDPISFDPWMFS